MADVITQGEIPDPRTLLVKLEALEKTQILFREDITRVPTAVQEATLNLRQLMESKMDTIEKTTAADRKRIEEVSEQRFARVDAGFVERDKRAEQLAVANSTALLSALAAQKEASSEAQRSQKEAIAKSEASTADTIKQNAELFRTSLGALATQYDELRSRIDRGDGGKVQKTESNNNTMTLIAVLAALALVAVDLGAAIINNRGAPTTAVVIPQNHP